jgi:hypothetical protein
MAGYVIFKDHILVMEKLIHTMDNTFRILKHIATVDTLTDLWLGNCFGYLFHSDFVTSSGVLTCLQHFPNFLSLRVLTKPHAIIGNFWFKELDPKLDELKLICQDGSFFRDGPSKTLSHILQKYIGQYQARFVEVNSTIMYKMLLPYCSSSSAFLDESKQQGCYLFEIRNQHQRGCVKVLGSQCIMHQTLYSIASIQSNALLDDIPQKPSLASTAHCHQWVSTFMSLKHRYSSILCYASASPHQLEVTPIKDHHHEDTTSPKERIDQFFIVLRSVLALIEETLSLLFKVYAILNQHPLNMCNDQTYKTKKAMSDFIFSDYASAVRYYVEGCLESENVELKAMELTIQTDALFEGYGDGWVQQRNNQQFKEER